MKRLIAALLLAASAATAHAGTGSLVDVTVRDLDTGRELPLYAQSGRWYVPGEAGHRYSVALENRTGERVLAVLSVDGVNAISGQTAAAQQTGYVLSPWQRTEVRGWRKNMGEVAEFYFTDLPDSYAARTGRPDNVGVIGVAVFRERVVPPPPVWRERDDEIASADRRAQLFAHLVQARRIELFDAFKAATGVNQPPATSKPDAAAAAKAAIAKAQTPVPASLSDFPGGLVGSVDELDAMRNMQGSDLLAKLEGKTPEQVAALMARLL